MKTYKISCTWEVCGELEIDADSLQEAYNKVEADNDIALPKANYIDGSFRIDRNMSRYLNEGLSDKSNNME